MEKRSIFKNFIGLSLILCFVVMALASQSSQDLMNDPDFRRGYEAGQTLRNVFSENSIDNMNNIEQTDSPSSDFALN